MADKISICEIFISYTEGEGMGCGLEFSDKFMDMSDDHKRAVVVAMVSTIQSFVDATFEEVPPVIEDATNDATNFLDRCVKEHGGRLQ